MSQAATFQRRNVPEQLALELADLICRGRWGAGQQLPGFRQLAEQYGVSLRSVQAALQLLEQHDLVELRPRQGAFVRSGGQISGTTTGRRIGVIWHSDYGNQQAAEDQIHEYGEDSWGLAIQRSFDVVLHQYGLSRITLPYMAAVDDPVKDLLGRIDECGDDLAGVLVFPRPQTDVLFDALDDRQIPWVTVNASPAQGPYNFVMANNQDAARRMGQCLIAADLHRVMILTYPESRAFTSIHKRQGLYQAYMEQGLPTDGLFSVSCQGMKPDDGYTAVMDYLSQGRPMPQVIYTLGDLLAFGALRACRERGVRVPEDVAIIGTTGQMAAQFTHPSLTVISQPTHTLGVQAARLLGELIQHRAARITGQRVPCPLVFRESFMPPASAIEQARRDYDAEAALAASWDERHGPCVSVARQAVPGLSGLAAAASM